MSKVITARPLAAAEPIARLKRQTEMAQPAALWPHFLITITMTQSYCDNDHTLLLSCKEGGRHNPRISYLPPTAVTRPALAGSYRYQRAWIGYAGILKLGQHFSPGRHPSTFSYSAASARYSGTATEAAMLW